MMTITLDAEKLPQLYRDLQDHYGTANATIPWIASTHWLNMALAELDTAYENQDWEHVVEMALNEGLDIDQYTL